MKAFLVLEDGTVYEGIHIGADKDVMSEIVFHTSMGGYLEVLTDPSYKGQTVCMTYPLIGNYGICKEDVESKKAWPDGIIVRELSRIPSNFRCEMTIQQFMEEEGITGIAGIDTRALTRHLREHGTMKGMITSSENPNVENIVAKLKEYEVNNLVDEVSTKESYLLEGKKTLEENGPIVGSSQFQPESYKKGIREPKPSSVKVLNGRGLKIAILDLGLRQSILDGFLMRGCDCMVYPAHTDMDTIIASKPDGILISNGPGNPKDCVQIIEEIKKLFDENIAVLGIGLGHQLLALAAGFDTYKMRHGHRGSNYPVKEMNSKKVYITSQNHGYVVDADSIKEEIAVPMFVNVNDGTNAGLSFIGKNIFSAQHYPDTYLGPKDEGSIFDCFIKRMKEENYNA